MALTNMGWPAEHVAAFLTMLAPGVSAAMIARQLNKLFGTSYSRNAIVGKAARMNVKTEGRPVRNNPNPAGYRKAAPAPAQIVTAKPYRVPRVRPPREIIEAACAAIVPRMIRCEDLSDATCRWPYDSGKGTPSYLFCGHGKPAERSYCGPHEQLSIGCGTRSEREANRV
jgi:GcrA cell cycle regulator